jgi:flagellar biosynthetic protein FliO
MDFVITIGALCLVLLIAFGVLTLMRRIQGKTGISPAQLKQLDAFALGARERLIVMQWRGDVLLLGVTASSISLLHRETATADDQDGGDPRAGSIDVTRGLAGLLAKSLHHRPAAPAREADPMR